MLEASPGGYSCRPLNPFHEFPMPTLVLEDDVALHALQVVLDPDNPVILEKEVVVLEVV